MLFRRFITKTLKTSLVFILLFSMFYSMSSADSWITIGTGDLGGGDGSPIITSVNPNSGLNNADTTNVVITGQYFTGMTSLAVGGTAITSFAVDSDTQITATVPAGLTPGIHHIVATNPTGSSTNTSADEFTAIDPTSQSPTVTSVTPNTGVNTATTSVTITGTNFTASSTASIGATALTSVAFVDTTHMTAEVPAALAAQIYDITVTNTYGVSAINANDKFIVTNPVDLTPTVTNVNPNTWPNSSSKQVTITGKNFTGTLTVVIGTTVMTVTGSTETVITAVVPAGLSAHLYDITVTTPNGTSAISPADEFTVTSGNGDIIIDNYEENGKPDARGQMDYYFVPKPGDIATDTQIASPVNSTTEVYEGSKSMELRYPGSTGSQWGGFWGGGLNPSTAAIDVSSGNMFVYYVKGDGTVNTERLSVTEYNDGTNDEAYRALDKYSLNNSGSFKEIKVPYTRIWRDEYTEAVKDDNIFSNKVKGYTFVYEGANATASNNHVDLLKAVNWTGPIIDLLGPSFGPIGTTVDVIGRNFGDTKGTSTVKLNGLTAATTSWSANKIVMTVPEGATSGLVEVTVGGQISNGVPFTVTAVPNSGPMITVITPNVGLAGTTVVITGTNFTVDPGALNRSTASYHITFGLNKITTANVTAWSDTSITVIVPSVANGVYPVQVRANDKESNLVDFIVGDPSNYVPTVTNVTPNTGVNTATTPVTITGTNFITGSTANIGATALTSVVIVSPTQMTAVVPAALAAQIYDIRVTNIAGTSAINANDRFTVTDGGTPIPTITGINPSIGPNNVPTLVTITGTSFTPTTVINLGTTPVTLLTSTYVSPTQITATVPSGIVPNQYHITATNGSVTSTPTSADLFTVTNGNGDIIIDNYEDNGRTDPKGQMDEYISSGSALGETTIASPVNSTTIKVEGLKSMQTTYPGSNTGQWGGYWGGYLLTPATDAIDISSANMLVYYVQGDGTSNTERLSVTEYNDGVNDEYYRALDNYSLNNTAGFKEIKVPYTRLWRDEFAEAAKDDNVFSQKVKGYSINYIGTNGTANSNYVDLLKAVNWTGPIIDLLGPSFGPIGTTVDVIGRNFGATQGTSTITLNGLTAATTSWSATKIVMTVPAGATSGPVEVTVGGAVSNGVPFTVTAVPNSGPMITAITPNVGLAGTTVVITGTNFTADPGAANRSTASYHITFGLNRITTANVTAWSDTSITVIVPTIANGVYPVQVRANDKESNLVDFTVGVPTSVAPPTNMKGVADSTTAITWSWSDNSNNETGFKVFDGAHSLKATTTADITSEVETGLSANTPYTRYATAYNVNGVSSASNSDTRYTLANPPVNLEKAGSTVSTISFTWEAGVGGASKYSVYRVDIAAGTTAIDPLSIHWIKIVDSTTNKTYKDTGLTPNTKYYYGVSAYNGDGIETSISSFNNLTPMSTLMDIVPPTITNVTFNDKTVFAGDIIKNTPTIKAFLFDNVAIKTSSITAEVGGIAYSVKPSQITLDEIDATSVWMTLPITTAIAAGPTTVRIYVEDTSDLSATYTIAVRVPRDDVYIEGDLFNYPNPFNPLGAPTTFGFNLSQDATVNLYLFDTVGRIVLNKTYTGTAGYNEIPWNGVNDYGEVSGNGVYLARLTYGSKLLGKCKVWVVKR